MGSLLSPVPTRSVGRDKETRREARSTRAGQVNKETESCPAKHLKPHSAHAATSSGPVPGWKWVTRWKRDTFVS